MHNRKGFNRLERKAGHRRALYRNMITSLLQNERIKTTQTKAKAVRRTAEKLVTRAKIDSVHNRRIAAKTISDKSSLNRLFTVIGPRFVNRHGGYTRILKLGYRSGDAAEMVLLEFLKEEEPQSNKQPSKGKKSVSTSAKRQHAPEKPESQSSSTDNGLNGADGEENAASTPETAQSEQEQNSDLEIDDKTARTAPEELQTD